MTTTSTDRKSDRWTPELRRRLDSAARHAGFALAGIASVRNSEDPNASRDAHRFAAWIDSGRAGEMDYLKRRDQSGSLLRASIRTAFPWARSAIVCAFDYSSPTTRSIDPAPSSAGWIARYAWSGRKLDDGTTVPTDYHDDLLARLRSIEAALLEHTACETRCYVDTGPLVERSLAAQSGIGWIGKNTCVINQQLGSWLLLGVILTSLPAEAEASAASMSTAEPTLPAADRCGTCTRCIDACPSGALLGSRSPSAPREMDASRCIAYLTIEKKGDIPEELRAPIGRNVFGCDICQDVCPWNRKSANDVRGPNSALDPSTHDLARSESQAATRPGPELLNSALVNSALVNSALINPALDRLAQMDSREFRRRFRGSPLERTGRKRLLRNVAIAMGNSGDPAFLPQLEQWASLDPSDHANDIALRDAAAWACERIRAGRSHAK